MPPPNTGAVPIIAKKFSMVKCMENSPNIEFTNTILICYFKPKAPGNSGIAPATPMSSNVVNSILTLSLTCCLRRLLK